MIANDLREDLGRDSQATVGGYMRRLSSGQKFMDLLNKHSINTALSTFAKEKDIGKLFSTALSNPADLSEEQRVIVTAFLNLLLYIDSSFIYCPACGNLVSLSWRGDGALIMLRGSILKIKVLEIKTMMEI